MPDPEGKIFLGASPAPQYLDLRYANRHGLVTGATGTGKTVSLQILAEGFARAGVPVFCADAKGDLSGIAMAGEPRDFLRARAAAVGLADEGFQATPTVFWDIFAEQGHPVRTTISETGPLLLSRMLDLTEAQEGALNIAFRIADEEGLLLLDLKDLRALLGHLGEQASAVTTTYGNVTRPTLGAIQRRLLVLANQGAEQFFGEPALDIRDLMRRDRDGRGFVNLLMAERLMGSPRLYATFLLWLLSELFEQLPEVGDTDRPKLVFFFDEAHLLFADAPPALIEKVERVVRLIRSKGVGVYFVTQSPLDIPDRVLAQLGNRIQHALRAYTPREQKAVRSAAETFRQNPAFDTEAAITELGVGEALVSMIGDKGVPSMVARTLIRPPRARIGPIRPEERLRLMEDSPVRGVYDRTIDRESAYERLATAAREAEHARPAEVAPVAARRGASPMQAAITSLTRAVASSVGRQIARSLIRGVLGSLSRR